jgi:hypothetical protein
MVAVAAVAAMLLGLEWLWATGERIDLIRQE